MKKSVKIGLSIGIIAFCLLTAALILVLGGKFFAGYYLTYKVNTDNETCTVTKCIPLGAKEITVPQTIGRYRVSEIGAYAFANRAKLKAICLPDGLETIGMGAFYECESLQAINVPNSVASIGSYAFFNCKELTSITLFASVTDIGARVFEGCTSLSTASVPSSAIDTLPHESITAIEVNSGASIGNYAFRDFVKLTSVTIAPSVEEIGIGAFMGCTNVTSATVPAHLLSYLPKNKLMHVVINGGTHIVQRALQNCSYLTSITLPESIVSIGEFAFSNCPRLIEIYNLSALEIEAGSLGHGNIGKYAMHIYNSIAKDSKTWVDDAGYLFYEDSEVCYLMGYMGKETELTLPTDCNGKKYVIRESAFYVESQITSVTIPESVLKIEKYAFAHCTGLKSVTFPDGLISIGEYTFVECESLEQISFGRSLASIGAFAFDECYNLARVFFRGTTEEWKAVEEGYCWIFYTPATEVDCTDGLVGLK